MKSENLTKNSSQNNLTFYAYVISKKKISIDLFVNGITSVEYYLHMCICLSKWK